MDVHINENGNIKYTYRIKKGISKIQGATLILEEWMLMEAGSVRLWT